MPARFRHRFPLSHRFASLGAIAVAVAVAVVILACQPARAQELLANGSFESPVAPSNGNNFYATIPGWTITNLTSAQSTPFNIILAYAGYPDSPTTTPTDGGAQYVDVVNASGYFNQSFIPPGDGIVTISGYFSTRDAPRNLSNTVITLKDNTGTVIGTASTSFTTSDPNTLWKQAKTQFIPVKAGTTYTYLAYVDDYANLDGASVYFYPAITVTNTSTPYSDPVNDTTNPKYLPAGLTTDTWTVSQPASYTSTALVMTMATPANTELVTSDYASAGSGPASFGAGASGLSYSFTSLANTADSIDFSNDHGTTWNYAPTVGSAGTDPTVTDIRVHPTGSVAPGSTMTVAVHFRIK